MKLFLQELNLQNITKLSIKSKKWKEKIKKKMEYIFILWLYLIINALKKVLQVLNNCSFCVKEKGQRLDAKKAGIVQKEFPTNVPFPCNVTGN